MFEGLSEFLDLVVYLPFFPFVIKDYSLAALRRQRLHSEILSLQKDKQVVS